MKDQRWKVDESGVSLGIVTTEGEKPICLVHLRSLSDPTDKAEALKTARLIAAAPDLLEAAQLAFDHLKTEQLAERSGQYEGEALNHLFAALKKAKGHDAPKATSAP